MQREPLRGGLEHADDGTVAGRAMDGDTAAFGILVRRHSPMMRAYTHRMLNASADVDDIVQETFVTAWQRFSELDDPARVKSWLMRILSRKAVDRIRALRPALDIEDVEQEAPAHRSPARMVEARAGVEALGAALQELPAAQRECWVLREMGGYSYDEIAAELEISVSTARGLLARARKYMIVRMEAWR